MSSFCCRRSYHRVEDCFIKKQKVVCGEKIFRGCKEAGGVFYVLKRIIKISAVNLKLSLQDRFEVVKKNRLCLICFDLSHLANDCKSRFRCHRNQKHYSMLYFEFKIPFQPSKNSNSDDNSGSLRTSEKSALSCFHAGEKNLCCYCQLS